MAFFRSLFRLFCCCSCSTASDKGSASEKRASEKRASKKSGSHDSIPEPPKGAGYRYDDAKREWVKVPTPAGTKPPRQQQWTEREAYEAHLRNVARSAEVKARRKRFRELPQRRFANVVRDGSASDSD
jgi:hypothetical protein